MTYHDSDNTKEGDATSYRSNGGGVDIVKGNGGYAIGYTAAGEWLEYSVDVTVAGEYSYEAYVSSGSTNSGFSLSLLEEDGNVTSLCKVNVPQTGDNDWSTYKGVKGKLSKRLKAGPQILRLTIDGPYCNIDKIVFTCTSPDGVETIVANPLPSSNVLYNISGQRVDENYKGLVIKNGRKMIMR